MVAALLTIERRKKVVGLRRISQFCGLLTGVSGAREVTIEKPGSDLVGLNGLEGRHPDEQLAAPMMGRPVDGFGRNFWLIDWGHRLSLMRQPALDPTELRRIHRGKMHHGHMDVASVMDQFGTQ